MTGTTEGNKIMSKVQFYGAVTLTGAPGAVEKAKPLLQERGASLFSTNEATIGLNNVKVADLPKLEAFATKYDLKVARCSCLQEIESSSKKPKKRNASRLNLEKNKWYYADAAEDRYPFLYVRSINVDDSDRQIFEVELLTPENAIPTKTHVTADELAKFGLRPASSKDFDEFELPVPAKAYITEAGIEHGGPETKALASWDLEGKKVSAEMFQMKQAFAKSLVAAFKRTAGYWGEDYQNSIYHQLYADEMEVLDKDDFLRLVELEELPASDDPKLMLDVLKEVYSSAIYDSAPSPDYFLDDVKSTVEDWIENTLAQLISKVGNEEDPWSLAEGKVRQAIENMGDYAADQAFFDAIGGVSEWGDFDTYQNDIVDSLWHEDVNESQLKGEVESLLWPEIKNVTASAGEEEWKSIQEDMKASRSLAQHAVQNKIKEMEEEKAEEEFGSIFHGTEEDIRKNIQKLSRDKYLSTEDIVREMAENWGDDYLDPSHPIWHLVKEYTEGVDPRQQQLRLEGKARMRRKIALYYHHARTLMEGLMQEIESTVVESEGQELEGSEGVKFARETYPKQVESLSDAQLEVMLDTFYQDWGDYVNHAFEYLHDELWAETEQFKNAWVQKWKAAVKKYLASNTSLTPDQKEEAYDLLMDEDDGILYAVWEEAGSGIGTWECEGTWDELCAMDIEGEEILALMSSDFTLHEQLFDLSDKVAGQALEFAVEAFRKEHSREGRVRRSGRRRQAMPLRPHHYDDMVKQCLREQARKSTIDHLDCVLDTLISWDAPWDEWEIMAEKEGLSLPDSLRSSGDLQELRMFVVNSLNYNIATPLNQGNSELAEFGGRYQFTVDDANRLVMVFYCPPDADCQGLVNTFGKGRRGSTFRKKARIIDNERPVDWYDKPHMPHGDIMPVDLTEQQIDERAAWLAAHRDFNDLRRNKDTSNRLAKERLEEGYDKNDKWYLHDKIIADIFELALEKKTLWPVTDKALKQRKRRRKKKPVKPIPWEMEASFKRRKIMARYDLQDDVAVFDGHVLNHLNYSDAYEGEADSMEFEVDEILPANASDEEFWTVVKHYDLRKKLGSEASEEDLQSALTRYIVMPMNSGYSELPAGSYEITLDEDTGRLALVFFADEEDMYELRNYLHGYEGEEL